MVRGKPLAGGGLKNRRACWTSLRIDDLKLDVWKEVPEQVNRDFAAVKPAVDELRVLNELVEDV